MDTLPLVYAPNPIFKMKAEPVAVVDDGIRQLVDKMLATIYLEGAVGLGANMVGVLKRIAVVDLRKDDVKKPMVFINPVITWHSEEKQTHAEASLCFPGIEAEITRPNAIKISFLDYDGAMQELELDGFLATVVQHEIDYLDGKVFLDYLPPMKRDVLLRKTQKHMKKYPPHVHSEHCRH